jgi:hypothetical protein
MAAATSGGVGMAPGEPASRRLDADPSTIRSFFMSRLLSDRAFNPKAGRYDSIRASATLQVASETSN